MTIWPRPGGPPLESIHAPPPLALADWLHTCDTLHGYSRLVGRIRRELSPAHPHWWHISLRPVDGGLSAPGIPSGDDRTFDLLLDLRRHALTASTNDGGRRSLPLHGQSLRAFTGETLAALASLGIEPPIDRGMFDDPNPGEYDAGAAVRYADALVWVHGVLERFKAGLPGDTSPVQLWPHHFDLAVTWFSGHVVAGVDPADREHADEHMTFGFSTGDEAIPEPYFYILAYPWYDDIRRGCLPDGAEWRGSGWNGGLMRYERVRQAADPAKLLLEFLRAGQAAGAAIIHR